MITFLKLLQAFKSNLKLIGGQERSRVVHNLNPKERDDRHGGGNETGKFVQVDENAIGSINGK